MGDTWTSKQHIGKQIKYTSVTSDSWLFYGIQELSFRAEHQHSDASFDGELVS